MEMKYNLQETYVYIDVSKKQEFIYSTNKLKENISRSMIIKLITENFDEMEYGNYDLTVLNKVVVLSREVRLHQGEFVFSGGGNSVIKFKNKEDATNFIRQYSLEVLKKYPELELYMSLVTMDEIKKDEPLNDTYNNEVKVHRLLELKLNKIKDERKSRLRNLSYGIEKTQSYKNKISKELNEIYNGLRELFGEIIFKKLQLKSNQDVFSLDKYNEISEKKYIGIIALDGNKMGEMVRGLKEHKKEGSYFEELSSLGKHIEEIYSQSLKEALKEFGDPLITPVVMAGDDLTLICEAKKAIQLAGKIITNIENISFSKDKLKEKYIPNKLTAGAGVAIVPTGYPFFEAVQIAEGIQKEAKESVYKIKEDVSEKYVAKKDENNHSFLSWQVVKSGKKEDIDYVNYALRGNGENKYHIKPLAVGRIENANIPIYTLEFFECLMTKFNKIDCDYEKIKKFMYGSEGQYDSCFVNSKEDRIISIDTEIKNAIDEHKLGISLDSVKYGKISDENGVTYLMNDFIEVRDFFESQI